MTEAETKTFYDILRYLCRLTVETDGVKAVCGQRHHILLAAGDEQHVSFVGELLKAEDVIIRFVPCIQETYGAEWAIHLGKRSHCVAEHRLSHCGTEGVGLSLIRDGFKTGKRLYAEALQGLCVDTVTSPKGQFFHPVRLFDNAKLPFIPGCILVF